MADRKGKGINNDDDDKDRYKAAGGMPDNGKGEVVVPEACEDEFDDAQERARQQRYSDKGKAKVEPDKRVIGDDSERDNDSNEARAQVDYDAQYAAMLQAEEYSKYWVGEAEAAVKMGPTAAVGDEAAMSVLPIRKVWTPHGDVTVGGNQQYVPGTLFGRALSLPPPAATAAAEAETNPALKMDPKTWRRNLPRDCICVTKTLTVSETIQYGARLQLDIFDTAALVDSPDIVDEPPLHLHKYIFAFDVEDIEYRMLVTQYTMPGEQNTHYCISEGWDHFVRMNRLKAGDEVNIFKTNDDRVCLDEPYFVIKFFRKPLPRCKPNLGTPKRKPDDDNNQGPPNPAGGAYKRLETRLNASGGIIFTFKR